MMISTNQLSRSLCHALALTVFGVAALVGSLRAASAADEGFYGTLKSGAAILGNMNYSDRATSDLRLDLHTGWTLGGALGYRFGNGFRTELSLDYLDGSLDGTYSENIIFVPCGTFAAQPCLGPGVNGDVKSWSGFAMGYYDFDLGTALTPYVGAGLGFARTGLEVRTTARLNNGTSSRFDIIDGHDTELGYRVTAGLAYDLGPTTKVDIGYSYTGTTRPSYAAKGSAVPSFTFDRRLNTHAVTAGIRFGF